MVVVLNLMKRHISYPLGPKLKRIAYLDHRGEPVYVVWEAETPGRGLWRRPRGRGVIVLVAAVTVLVLLLAARALAAAEAGLPAIAPNLTCGGVSC